jgi:peptidoglycan/LPS O-acetylase OafA/YrhL
MVTAEAAGPRHNNFDAVRLVAALSVIFSHSFLIAQGTGANDPLNLLTGNQCMLGLAGVFVFFAISGYLVTQSFEQTHGPLRYLAKRCLRIFPAYFVVLVLTAFVLGPVVTTLPLADYLHRPEPYWYVIDNAFFSLKLHELPGVMFVDNPVGLEVNGALWSLGFEFGMYLMVLVLGALRLIKLPVCLLLLALGMAFIHFDVMGLLASWGSVFSFIPGWNLMPGFLRDFSWATGFVGGWGWMLGFFAAGMVVYKLRGWRIFNLQFAFVAAVGLVIASYYGQFILYFPLFGCYLALYVALNPKLPVIPAARFGDLSYGLYIYGWPSQQTVIWLMHGHANWWQVFLLATPLAGLLAFLSWHLIEKRALRLKPGSGTWQGSGLWILQKPWRLKSPTVATSTSSTAKPSS